MGGYAPRALKDSMRRRRLGGASGRPLNFTVRFLSNNFFLALYISGAAVVVGYALATPAILIFHRTIDAERFWTYATLPLAIAAWWCAYSIGLGPQSPFNIQELFILTAIYVLAIYALLMLQRRFQFSATLPGVLAAVCFSAVVVLRLLTPAIGE